MRKHGIDLGVTVGIQLVLPGRFVVAPFLRVPAGAMSFAEIKTFLNQERRIGMEPHVIGMVQLAAERVVNETAEVGNVTSSADGDVTVRERSRSIETRIDADQLCFPVSLGLHNE